MYLNVFGYMVGGLEELCLPIRLVLYSVLVTFCSFTLYTILFPLHLLPYSDSLVGLGVPLPSFTASIKSSHSALPG